MSLAALWTLRKLEPAVLAPHAARFVAKLSHEDKDVRIAAFRYTLGKLAPAVLAPHAAGVVARLEDEDSDVRIAALETLCKLEPAVLSQYGASVNDRVCSWKSGMLGAGDL